MKKILVERKAPNRSKITDKELAEKIRKERSERPDEFITACASSSPKKSYCMSSAAEVIAKWL